MIKYFDAPSNFGRGIKTLGIKYQLSLIKYMIIKLYLIV